VQGATGVDRVWGGLGQDDHGDLTGDGDTVRGIETVSYESATAGITVDLRARTGRVSGRRQTDRLVTPRELLGSEHADVLIGSSGDEAIYGLGGNDRIEGEDGRDYLLGGEGDDVLRAGPGDFEELAGGPGHDTLDGGPGDNDNCYGGPVKIDCEISSFYF